MTFSITYLIMSFIGVAVGIVFGALPGMTATMAIAIFLPLTYAYDLHTSLFLLLGLYVGGISGGLIPAILVNIPGTPSSICTGFDGYPMARRGEGEKALKIGITASFIGGMISLGCLLFFTPPLAKVAINFGAVEKFLVILFALTVIAALSKGDMLKGVFAGFLGVLVSLMDCYSFNSKFRMVPPALQEYMYGGFSLLPVLIGLFALTQIFQEAEMGMKENAFQTDAFTDDASKKFHFSCLKGQGINLVRSALIGTFVGVLPGVGGSAASLLSYSQAKNFSKHPEKLGTGVAEGLVASEAANNGLTGGALIPLLSLGIPGDSTTAVLVGAFMLQGVSVGPLFISQNPDLWHAILFGLLVANLFMFVLMFYPIKWISKIINLPKTRLYPVIILMCVVGAYSANNGNMFDVWTMLLFGFLGYVFSKVGLSAPSFLIGFILGRDLEAYFIEAIQGSQGSLLCFFQRPIGNVLWLLILASVAFAVWDSKRTRQVNHE